MLNEFYKYIANNTVGFFQSRSATLRPGERYCLRLDTEEMVAGVDEALRHKTLLDGIQGEFHHENVYSTFTIKLSSDLEIVVASKINGMTDDFLATLRNANLTDQHFPILMITHSPIDTITSGTGDLAANGMPFHAASIIAKIKEDIRSAELSAADRILLEMELERKQSDRFSDKSSLFEYSNLLTVLGRGYVTQADFASFALLEDASLASCPEDRIRARLTQNHTIFEQIDRVFKHGNIADALDREYDKRFIEHLVAAKRKGEHWYEGHTFDYVLASRDRLVRQHNNPLSIENEDIVIFSGSSLEYEFAINSRAYIRCDGETKAKQRRKNIIIYNPDQKQTVTILVHCNVTIKDSWITDCIGAEHHITAKDLHITIQPTGCSFARVTIKDPNNNITYLFKICVLNILPKYLEEIQTCYVLDVPKSIKRATVQAIGLTKTLTINPGCTTQTTAALQNGEEYSCAYDQTLQLALSEEAMDPDSGLISIRLKCGAVEIPFQIKDEPIKPTELTGISAFKKKHSESQSFEYREGKIIMGTTEYFAKSPFKENLILEDLFIQNGWLAITQTVNGFEECPLNIPQAVKDAYLDLVQEFRRLRSLPSIAYYCSHLYRYALAYVEAVEAVLFSIPAGETMSSAQNDILRLGCVFSETNEWTISMSPLQPMNVLYQLTLLNEEQVGEVRENLVEKLSPLYLLPYIRNVDKSLFQAVEQRHSPEWRIYAPLSNKRYQGARNFVQRMVCDKIVQYIDHFTFLFDDLGNDLFCINLINMGDCREVLQGLIRFYAKELQRQDISTENLKRFVINIYQQQVGDYSDFSVLADSKKLKDYIATYGKDIDDLNEMALILSKNIRCFYRNLKEPTFQYAHLTFYEMESSADSSDSRMDSIVTGVALDGLTSGTPSVLSAEWYKTGFGLRHAPKRRIIQLAKTYNALYRVAYSGGAYEPESAIFTEIASGEEEIRDKIYASSNWVVFVSPKVDLSFFRNQESDNHELMIIHYSDQYTSASGYDDITVTQKSSQYEEIIFEQLQKKGVNASKADIHNIISLFNAINGGWMLRLISSKKLSGAVDSNFSREKMSILSAVKLCMAYYSHSDIIWVPISLEEMLRVSGGAGYSQKEGLLSAKNLGFDKGVTSDDLLMVGIEGPVDDIKIYLHPVEVKIGINLPVVISKAKEQVKATYTGLWNALWPDENRSSLECKLSRNFLMQLVIMCCEKMRLYNVYPDEQWDLVLNGYRESLMNEKYRFSDALDALIGKGTVISFKTDILHKSGALDDDIFILEFPEKMGSEFMIKSAHDIERALDRSDESFPNRLKFLYESDDADPSCIPTPPAQEWVSLPENNLQTASALINSFITPDVPETPEAHYETENNQISDADSEPASAQNDIAHTPENEQTCMEILLGTDISNGQPLFWRPNDTEQVFHTNTGIIGTMGTGKTQFTKSLITQLYRDQSRNFGGTPLGILIFDYKGDYNESKEDFVSATNAKILKPYHLPFNPLALTQSRVFKPLLPIHTANAFKDTIAKVYGLGAKQQNALFSCITRAYAMSGIEPANSSTWDNTPPTFDSVYRLYIEDEDIKKNDSLAAAMDKLYQFQVFESDPDKTESLFSSLNGVVVVDLSGYDSDIQSLIVAITLDLFYAQMQAAGSSKMDHQYRQLTKLILVDEADNFMSEGFPSLKKILKEGREFGVGTILSTQFLKHFGSTEDDYAKYILTWVVHNVADLKPSDVEFVFKTEAKSSETQMLFNDIKGLQKHHSIVKIGTESPRYIRDRAFWELYRELTSN